MVRNNLLILICIKNEPSSDQPLTVKDDKNWFLWQWSLSSTRKLAPKQLKVIKFIEQVTRVAGLAATSILKQQDTVLIHITSSTITKHE